MKKQILLFLFTLISLMGFSQAKYYWVGGTGGSWSSTAPSSWNTSLDGSGTGRTSILTGYFNF